MFLIVNNNLFSQSPTHNKHANSLIFTLSSHLFFFWNSRGKNKNQKLVSLYKKIYITILPFSNPDLSSVLRKEFLNILFWPFCSAVCPQMDTAKICSRMSYLFAQRYIKVMTFRLHCVSKYNKLVFSWDVHWFIHALSSSVSSRLPLYYWVEKARLHKPCWGVWGQLLLIYQQWHYQQWLVKREPVIQNSGATLAVKAGFRLHFPWLPWRLWEVIMKRGFRAALSHQWVLP